MKVKCLASSANQMRPRNQHFSALATEQIRRVDPSSIYFFTKNYCIPYRLEIRQYRLVAFFDSIVYGLFFANTKIFILFAVLSSYYFDGVSGLKSDHIFVATAMFNMFRMPVGLFLPFAIKFLMEYKISVKRIQEFLLLKDQNVQCLPKENIRSQNDTNEECQVSMMNYSAKFSEQNETNVVEDINFNLKPGKLMMIVGPVGSGKLDLSISFSRMILI
uniref:ABC transmembrane type-1 domain-containing protein n=1 Tax=Romanomermis culicivorax TaxID=13658 RepID=A0A915IU41_ROMCU